MSFGVWNNNASRVNCQIAQPKANDLLLLIVRTGAGVSASISGTGCTGGYWTAQTSPINTFLVYTATANGSTDPTSCTISQVSGNIDDAIIWDIRSTNGNVPLLDTSCGVQRSGATSAASCTLTTSVNGELVLTQIDNFDGGCCQIQDLDNSSIPDYWGLGAGRWAAAHAGVATAGASTAVTAQFGVGNTPTVQTAQFAIAANNGAGVKTAGYLVLNAQPDGNPSVSNNGVMTIPFGSSPQTPTFPANSFVTGTVVAKVLCGTGTCGTVTPPTGWNLVTSQVGPAGGVEVRSYCHNYTGVEGAQSWSFAGGTDTTSFFVQYVPTNIPTGTCTATSSTATASTDLSFTTPNATADGIFINGIASNNTGQLWRADTANTWADGYYGTSWGTCQIGGNCDHENYHTDYSGLHSGTYSLTYQPTHGSYAATAPSSISLVDTFIGPTASSSGFGFVVP